ncbi:cell division cycle-associated protein 3 [Rhinophrynus dorsalis]
MAVGDSPRNTPQSVQEEEVQELPIISDPRSPTHGIARTPLRPPLHEALNLLVKQLNEVFVAEDSGIEESPPYLQSLHQLWLPPQRSRSKSPRSAGIKTGRQRPKKALLTSASGRSPLRILQEDNSPRMAVPNRQGKKLSFQSEPSSSLRAVKIPHSAWETSHNKENAQYGQSTS